MSSAKWRLFCLGLNVLSLYLNQSLHDIKVLILSLFVVADADDS